MEYISKKDSEKIFNSHVDTRFSLLKVFMHLNYLKVFPQEKNELSIQYKKRNVRISMTIAYFFEIFLEIYSIFFVDYEKESRIA